MLLSLAFWDSSSLTYLITMISQVVVVFLVLPGSNTVDQRSRGSGIHLAGAFNDSLKFDRGDFHGW